MQTVANPRSARILATSTVVFIVCFADWTIFVIIDIRIRDDLGLNETQFGLVVGTPILAGSLLRVPLGIRTDRYGGRVVFTQNMIAVAVGRADTEATAHQHTRAMPVRLQTRRSVVHRRSTDEKPTCTWCGLQRGRDLDDAAV